MTEVIMRLKVLQFLAVVLIAMALVPVGAHLLARPNKIDMPEDQYFVAQAVYLVWGLPSSIVLVAAILTSLVLAIAMRGRGRAFWLALAAFVLMAATLVDYFVWTEPANQATDNWTFVPENWSDLRPQWEYSHTANAIVTFIALCAVMAATLIERREHAPLTGRREPVSVG
jgi:hypothetical protein